MANPKNTESLAQLKDSFDGASAILLTEYRGLTVAQMTELRRKLGSDVTYSVAKNTMIKLAAERAGVEGLDEHLTGPTAVAFISGEAVDAAKTLKDFGKDHKVFLVKGGYMDGRALSAAEVDSIAELDNRETTLAKIAGAFDGALSSAAALFNAPASEIARLAAALEEKK